MESPDPTCSWGTLCDAHNPKIVIQTTRIPLLCRFGIHRHWEYIEKYLGYSGFYRKACLDCCYSWGN